MPTFARAERVAAGERPDHQKPEDEPYVIRPSGRGGPVCQGHGDAFVETTR